MTELKYEQLNDEQKSIADTATILETETNLYLVEENGKLRGYRAVEMFDNGKPVKWSEVLSLSTGMPLPKEKKNPLVTKLAALAKKTVAPGATDLIKTVPINVIDRCALNPRKHFDRARLDELKASFRTHGFVAEMSHLWVRPHPTQPNRFELIDGERRWIVIGELVKEEMFGGMVPVTISTLTNAQVLNYALLNARQREELTPIEEAEAICLLLREPKENGQERTMDDVASEQGCKVWFIAQCKLLRKLRGTLAGEAVEAGKLTREHGEILGRIGDSATRDALTKRVLTPTDGRDAYPVKTLSLWVRDEVQRSLQGAPFSRASESLVPVQIQNGERVFGGACGIPTNTFGTPVAEESATTWKLTCPFTESSDGKAMCLNPECFKAKVAASSTGAESEWRAEQERAGRTVIEGEAADALWDFTGTRLHPKSGYVELDAKPEEWDLKAGQVNGLTWKKLLRQAGHNDIPAIPVLVVKDRNRAAHELVKRDEAKRTATEIGHDIFRGMAGEAAPAESAGSVVADDGDPRIASAAAGVQRDAAREARQAEQAERDAAAKREGLLAERTTLALKRGVMEGSRGLKRLAPEFWHLILGPMVDAVKEQGGLAELCEVLGKADADACGAAALEDWLDGIVRGRPVEQMPSLAIAVAREMLYAGETEVWMKLACKTFGVDTKAVRKRVAGELEAEERAAAERAEIENGVGWSQPLKEKADEFEWLSDGDCANANVAPLALPQAKGTAWNALIGVARTHKGWHAGHALYRGKKPLAHCMPNMNSASYSNASLASATALRAVHQAMVDASAPEPMQARVAAYIAAVKLPAEKPAKAKPVKKSTKGTKGTKKKGGKK